ncbi:hypothetical protein SteCoe_12334 [Stentor coeruleus]|uniref:Uncharacterized protein n=1 Tax=Stentor coeruleus TaxID=5963 RepID=A0A1R2CB22_9CILI|nr:hypothetical protein SteCoe_12334 [Stentor coeruleus]
MDDDPTLRIQKLIKPPSKALIHERLFKESILCQKLSTPYQKKLEAQKSEPLRNGQKIEDALIQSKHKSKAEILQLKKKYQSEELKSLQKVPKINENSKLLASRTSSFLTDIKSAYLKSIITSSRPSRITLNQHSRTIKTARICLDDLDLRPSYCKTPHAYKVIPTKERPIHIQTLTKNYESPQSPVNLLNMDTLSRNQYWIQLKAQHLEKIQKEVFDKTTKECLFSPKLVPRINISCITPQPKSFNISPIRQKYSIRGSQNSSPMLSPSSGFNSKISSLREKFEINCYGSLSPHRKKIGFKAGMNLKKFMQVAQPMIRYMSPRYLR